MLTLRPVCLTFLDVFLQAPVMVPSVPNGQTAQQPGSQLSNAAKRNMIKTDRRASVVLILGKFLLN